MPLELLLSGSSSSPSGSRSRSWVDWLPSGGVWGGGLPGGGGPSGEKPRGELSRGESSRGGAVSLGMIPTLLSSAIIQIHRWIGLTLSVATRRVCGLLSVALSGLLLRILTSAGKEFITARTNCVSVVSPCWTFFRALLLQVPWVLSSLARRLLRVSDNRRTRSGKHRWMSSVRSWSRSSLSCLERVLSATSRPPLQRTGHVHQTIGRRARDRVDNT